MASERARRTVVGDTAAALALLAAAALAACREIPPEIPAGFVGSAPERGSPPLPVYHPDPFHPANLLFHRLFIFECDPAGDLPASARGPLDGVDMAELRAFCDAVRGALGVVPGTGSAGAEPPTPRGLAMLRLDLASEAARLRARGNGGDAAAAGILEALRGDLPPPADGEPGLPPPPGGARTAAELDRRQLPVGHPLPPPGGLEAWALEPPSADRATDVGPPAPARAYRFRRARWLRGDDPWMEEDVDTACGACHYGP